MTGSTGFTVGILFLLLCSSRLSVLVSAAKLTLFLGFRGFFPGLALASEELDPSTLVAFGLVPNEPALSLLSAGACWTFSVFCTVGPSSSAFDGRSFTPALRRVSRSWGAALPGSETEEARRIIN